MSGWAGELEWPFITVSDVLSSSGGAVLYGSWIVAFGIALRRGRHKRLGSVAALAPIFTPRGMPKTFSIESVPAAVVLHYLWAFAFIALVVFSPDRGTRRVSSAIAPVWAVAYFGGQWIACNWIIFVGCVLEWALLFTPALHPCLLWIGSIPVREDESAHRRRADGDLGGLAHARHHASPRALLTDHRNTVSRADRD